MLQEIGLIFNRALKFSFCKKKFFFLFPILILCGVLIVLCHALSLGSNPWVNNSLTFLPSFLCAGILMSIGVPLVRIYYDEVKKRPFTYRAVIGQSWQLMTKIAFSVVPFIFAYLVLWVLLGVFYLLKNLPKVGEFLGGFFSFGPFLLIFGSLILMGGALLLLFFFTPMVALRSQVGWNIAEELYKNVRANLFRHLFLLGMGVIPLLAVIGFLILSAALTGITYFIAEHPLAIASQWFFIMIPFAAFLTPAVLFFFNFSAESFAWMQKNK